MRKLIEITFMSLDGVIDAPDIIEEARPYFGSREEQDYQKARLLAADALLLGRKTYEKFSQAYPSMEKAGQGAPMDLVRRMNSIPKYVASSTLREASWNAAVIRGDVADEIRKIKNQPGKDLLKYGTGALDRVLFGERLVDVLCLLVYPFALGHGTRLLEGLGFTTRLRLSEVRRFDSGAMLLEYVPKA